MIVRMLIVLKNYTALQCVVNMQIYPVDLAQDARLLIVEDFFPEELLTQIHRYLDTWQNNPEEWIQPEPMPLRRQAQGTDPVYDTIRNYFDSNTVLTRFQQYVPGTRLFVSNFAIWLDQTGTGPLAAHYEQSDSRLAQIFVTKQPNAAAGTTIYNDQDDVLIQLPYRNNFGWFFDRGSTVRHGRANPVPTATDRFIIMAWYGDYGPE